MLTVRCLDGRVAVVTGASKGIGRALAIGLAESGARVVINYKTDRAGGEETCRHITNAGGEALPEEGSVWAARQNWSCAAASS